MKKINLNSNSKLMNSNLKMVSFTESSEDISPYATFQLSEASTLAQPHMSGPANTLLHSFMYHERAMTEGCASPPPPQVRQLHNQSPYYNIVRLFYFPIPKLVWSSKFGSFICDSPSIGENSNFSFIQIDLIYSRPSPRHTDLLNKFLFDRARKVNAATPAKTRKAKNLTPTRTNWRPAALSRQTSWMPS